MSRSSILKGTIVCIFTGLVVLSSFLPFLPDPQPAVAQPVDCGASGETIELKYDDGEPYETMYESTTQICKSCLTFQGVLFSLPEGVSSSILRRVRFYAGGKATVQVRIMDTSNLFTPGTLLTPKIAYRISEQKWHEIPVPDVVVPNRFWVFLEVDNLLTCPFYDTRRDGNSWTGSSTSSLVSEPPKRPRGDFLIRAYIVPEATVGVGEGFDYDTIQEAVDEVDDGWTITVNDGTYYENVTVHRSVIIKSVSGPAKTIVRTSPSHPDSNVFKITASCVELSGFTIQGAVNTGRAGVRIEDASGCVISGNVIQDNSYGIFVSEKSASNILLENECTFNTNGIYVDGSENYISGNNLHGNTASVGSAVYLSAFGSGNQLRFNTVTIDPGTDPTVAASAQLCNQNSTEQVSAIENWWGTDSGPSNAGGQGPLVGEGIRFEPWLGKQPVRVNTVAARAGPFVLDGRTETSVLVVKEGAGSAFISAANFAENPVGKFRYKTPGKWIDVLLSSAKGIDQVEIRVVYTADEGNPDLVAGLKEGSLRLFWWNGEKWKKCSKTGVDKENDFVWARLNLKSTPTLSDLGGTMFALGIPKGNFAWWLIPVIVLIVLLLLIVMRLVWVLAARRGGGYTSID